MRGCCTREDRQTKKRQRIVSSVCATTDDDLPEERFTESMEASVLLAKINKLHYTTFYE